MSAPPSFWLGPSCMAFPSCHTRMHANTPAVRADGHNLHIHSRTALRGLALRLRHLHPAIQYFWLASPNRGRAPLRFPFGFGWDSDPSMPYAFESGGSRGSSTAQLHAEIADHDDAAPRSCAVRAHLLVLIAGDHEFKQYSIF